MNASENGQRIESLVQQSQWEDARKLIEQALLQEPGSHWLLTHLGLTYYEQGDYRESVRHFVASLKIVPDCPLTLWNLAGALDAIGKPDVAIPIYTWLLKSKRTAAGDPCWESDEWADALKMDCVYRIGVCFQHMGRWESSEHCFRQYLNLLLAGVNGTYSIEEVTRQIRDVHAKDNQSAAGELRGAIEATLRDTGIASIQVGRRPPIRPVEELLAN